MGKDGGGINCLVRLSADHVCPHTTKKSPCNASFYKELGNQGLKATDAPVVAFSLGIGDCVARPPSRLVSAWLRGTIS